MSFLTVIEQWGEAEFAKLKKSAGPLLVKEEQAGIADLRGDAVAALAQVANDPSLLTDEAKRNAAVTTMEKNLGDQAEAVGKNSLVAAVALAQVEMEPAKAAVAPETPPQPAA
jgi:hypothetical protein